MNYHIKFRLVMCLCVVAAIIAFPFILCAEGSKKFVEHEASVYYTIRKRDTLWDISYRFFDTPWQWPDIWSENNQIANPHRIYPGDRIRLFQRKDIEKSVDTNIDIEKKVSYSNSVVKLKNLNFKKIKYSNINKIFFEQINLPRNLNRIQKKPLYYFYSSIDKIGFIKKEPVNPLGTIFKVKDDKEMISKGDLVYIRPNENASFIQGSKFTVYKTLKSLRDGKTNSYIGIQYYLTGIVEIIKKDPQFVVARVVKSFRTIEVNNLLMPYVKRLPKVILTESKKKLKGKIIVSEERASIIGDNTVAFINKGSKNGVKSGQSYTIFYQEKKRLDPAIKADVLLPPVDFGTLLVLHAEETTATVLITSAEKSIYPGANIYFPLQQ